MKIKNILQVDEKNQKLTVFEPYSGAEWNARKKDVLENKLRRLVCSKQLDIKVAQDAISKNWIEAYKKYVEIKK